MKDEVTPEMRELHYNTFGHMVDDIEIWTWYLSHKEVERRREAHRRSIKRRKK